MSPDALLLDSGGGPAASPFLTAASFQRPVFRFPVILADDAAPQLADPPLPDWTLGFPGFAKLGAKSWRDGGDLHVVPADAPFAAAAAAMLARLSPVQHRYLARIRPLDVAIDLSVFRYVDFTDISEARWIWRDGRARLSSRCRRGASAAIAGDDDAMAALIRTLSPHLPAHVIVDLAVEPDGRITVLDLNPPG